MLIISFNFFLFAIIYFLVSKSLLFFVAATSHNCWFCFANKGT